MDYRILGTYEVLREGEPLALGGHRQRGVLVILTLAANRPVAAGVLADRLWAGNPPPSAANTLQAYVSDLRRVLEPDRAPRTPPQVLTTVPGGYLLRVPQGAVDADRFAALVADGKAALAGGDASTAARLLGEALAQWRGAPLADFADEPFAHGERVRLEEARLQALETRIAADLALGRHADVVAELGALVAEHPLRESLRGQLMLALYRAGRQAEALDVARSGRELLADELGLDPDPELRRLEDAILRQDPELAWAGAPAPARPAASAAGQHGGPAASAANQPARPAAHAAREPGPETPAAAPLPPPPPTAAPPTAAPPTAAPPTAAPPTAAPPTTVPPPAPGPSPVVPRPAGAAAPPDGDGLVGREDDRGVLERALAAAAGGTGRLVLIGGEPGIGKTRLAEAFADGVAGARVLWGRCHQAEGAPPFWPWRQVLRALAEDIDDAELAATLGDEAGLVTDVAPELRAHLPDTTPGRLPDADAARFRFFDAATRLLSRVAVQRPTVVVLDDLHWADAPSLELLSFLAGSLRASGLLVVATYRSVAVADGDLLARTLAALAREPSVERLLLPGLEPGDVAALLARMLDTVPDDALAAAVHARTGGNPLFVIHLARLLRAEARAGAEDAERLVRERVPHEIIDLIGWRVAEQPVGTRGLLEAAAVVGREFDLGLVADVRDTAFDEALALMGPAVAAGLVVEDAVPGTYRFTHALMREAILAGLGAARAGRLHGLIGDALASRRRGDESLPAIAHHYWQAATVGWADAALAAAVEAAAQATAGLADEDARRHLDHATALLARRPAGPERDRVELSVVLQQATHQMRTRGYAVDAVGEACRRARELADRVGAAGEHLVASWGLAAHHLVRGEHPAAVAVGRELLDTAEATGNPVAALAGHQTTGVPLLYLGRCGEARHHLEHSIAVARELPAEVLDRFPQNVEVGSMAFLAVVTWLQGDADDADAVLADALDRATRLGGYDEVFARMIASQLGVLRRAPEDVLTHTAVMLEACGPAGFRHVAAHARVMRGWALSLTGDPSAGTALVEQGMAYFDANETSTRRSHNFTLFAEALTLAGRHEAALAAVEQAIAQLDEGQEPFFAPETWRLHASLLAAGPNPSAEDVRASLVHAVEAAAASGAVALQRRAEEQLAAGVGSG